MVVLKAALKQKEAGTFSGFFLFLVVYADGVPVSVGSGCVGVSVGGGSVGVSVGAGLVAVGAGSVAVEVADTEVVGILVAVLAAVTAVVGVNVAPATLIDTVNDEPKSTPLSLAMRQ
jgi:hypothetical protein